MSTATKSYVDTSLNNVYNKAYVDTSLNNFYNKVYVDGSLNTINTSITTLLPKHSPSFTNTLLNNNNTFSVDASGNMIVNGATFSGTVSGINKN